MGDGCLFEHRMEPRPGDGRAVPCISSVRLGEDGRVTIRLFAPGEGSPRFELLVATRPDLADAVRAIADRHGDALSGLPTDVRVAGLDGTERTIRIGGTEVATRGLRRGSDAGDGGGRTPGAIALRQMATLLDAYDEVAVEFVNRGIVLPADDDGDGFVDRPLTLWHDGAFDLKRDDLYDLMRGYDLATLRF